MCALQSNTSQDPLACPSNDKHANSTQVIGPHRSYSGDKFTSAAHGASTVSMYGEALGEQPMLHVAFMWLRGTLDKTLSLVDTVRLLCCWCIVLAF